MLLLKFLIMAVAALVEKIFQSELRATQRTLARAVARDRFYNTGLPPRTHHLGARHLDIKKRRPGS